ncbi:MAG: hypothetical protein B5M53_00965 [Candidatus Cloacimonas sp. 4484_209]|nr:MAG: hypothetical protein B5M53_00965 [Candidatus Cloacimonas sp. 4484_209]
MDMRNEYERTGEHFNIERKVVYDGKEYERTGRYFRMPSGTSALVYVDKEGKEYVLYRGEMTSIEQIKEMKEEKQEEEKSATTEVTTTEVAPPEKEQPVEVEVLSSEADLERADLLEAQDIVGNSDLVLQYSAPFKNRRTGKVEMRSWLGTNAWKLGLAEGYLKQGFSCNIKYEDTDEFKKCTVTLKKGDQEIVSEGIYTKSRLKSFLHPAKEEALSTFSFRNAIKKIVSLRDVVRAVIETQKEVQKMGALPTKKIEE